MRALASAARGTKLVGGDVCRSWGGRRPGSHNGGSRLRRRNARYCPQGRTPTARRARHHGLARVRRRLPHARSPGGPRRLAGAARRSAPAAARARRARLSPRARRRGRPHGPDRRGRGRHGARADPVRSAQRDPGGSGRAEGRLSAAGGARLFDRTRQGHADGPHLRARFRAAGAHRRLCARAQPAAAGALQRRRARLPPRSRGRGHARRVLLRHRHRRHPHDCRARAFRLRRDAGRAGRGFHRRASAGGERDGQGREARSRARRRRGGDRARAADRGREGAPALSGAAGESDPKAGREFTGAADRRQARRQLAFSPSLKAWLAALASCAGLWSSCRAADHSPIRSARRRTHGVRRYGGPRHGDARHGAVRPRPAALAHGLVPAGSHGRNPARPARAQSPGLAARRHGARRRRHPAVVGRDVGQPCGMARRQARRSARAPGQADQARGRVPAARRLVARGGRRPVVPAFPGGERGRGRTRRTDRSRCRRRGNPQR